MPVTYENRKGKRYHLRQDVTKTGRTRYFFSPDDSGELVESVPEGYEITESVNGIVSLRKKVTPLITEEELRIVQNALDRLPRLRNYRTDVKGQRIVIYEPIRPGVAEMLDVLGELGLTPVGNVERLQEQVERTMRFSPIMQFTLADRQARTFKVDRMCFVGGEERWHPLEWGKLPALVKRYVKHLGQDSFFELI